jgi:hypothetical protein
VRRYNFAAAPLTLLPPPTLPPEALPADSANTADSSDSSRIAQALSKFEPALRGAVKAAGFLTRDPRVVERKKYGRAKETAYQLSKAGEELNRDLEHAFVGLDQAAVAGNSTLARQMASAIYQVSSTTTVTTDSSTSTTGNQAGALTEANVLTCHQTLYNEGGEPSILMVKPADAKLIAAFTGASGRYRNINDGGKTLVNAVDIYVSPFGELKVVINRFIKTDHALMYEPDMWRKVTLRPWTRTMLAKDGDNEKHMLVGEFSLKHMNQKGSGKIKNLT